MNNSFTSAETFLKLSNLFGLFPLSFCGSSRKGLLKTRWTDVFKSICLVLIVAYFMAATLMKKVSSNGSSFLFLAVRFAFNIQYFINLHVVWYQLRKRMKVVEFFKTIEKTDAKVS